MYVRLRTDSQARSDGLDEQQIPEGDSGGRNPDSAGGGGQPQGCRSRRRALGSSGSRPAGRGDRQHSADLRQGRHGGARAARLRRAPRPGPDSDGRHPAQQRGGRRRRARDRALRRGPARALPHPHPGRAAQDRARGRANPVPRAAPRRHRRPGRQPGARGPLRHARADLHRGPDQPRGPRADRAQDQHSPRRAGLRQRRRRRTVPSPTRTSAACTARPGASAR